ISKSKTFFSQACVPHIPIYDILQKVHHIFFCAESNKMSDALSCSALASCTANQIFAVTYCSSQWCHLYSFLTRKTLQSSEIICNQDRCAITNHSPLVRPPIKA
uniref:Uncharacterized protein n=1 Tax=Labrus bergylta TaxID=56723 RepID=A0A3Q3EXT8_9LABR